MKIKESTEERFLCNEIDSISDKRSGFVAETEPGLFDRTQPEAKLKIFKTRNENP